jgi:hypothetical protein
MTKDLASGFSVPHLIEENILLPLQIFECDSSSDNYDIRISLFILIYSLVCPTYLCKYVGRWKQWKEDTKRNGVPSTLSRYVATLYFFVPLAKQLTGTKKTKDGNT